MVFLIALPFAVLILAITIIRLRRNLQAIADLQNQRKAFEFPPTHHKPFDDFHDRVWLPLCDRIADAASAKLGRPLTTTERRAIWRCRSQLILDVAAKEIDSSASAQQIIDLLASIPSGIDRPDPNGWCAK